MNNNTPLDTLTAIRQRRSIKVLSDTPLPIKAFDEQLIETLLISAYWAPFHYPCHREHKTTLSSDLPFRFYVLDSQCCRDLAKKLETLSVEASKLIAMLNTADYLIQATWLSQPSDDEALFEASITNMEHIAAASAAIQNLLLTATALGQENYWGSGGVLREAFAFDLLGIPSHEILLGSLFLFPQQSDKLPDDIQFSPSQKRDRRGDISQMYRQITVIK